MESFEDNLSQEIRFAVVMYGGVSLAIYINGVTQELYRLVGSTAEGWPSPKSGTEEIYREIAEKLKARFVIDILSGTSAGGINAIFLAKALANGQNIDQLEQLWLNEGNIEVLINDKRSLIEGLQNDFAKPSSLLNSQRMYKRLLEAFNAMDETAGVSKQETPSRSLIEELDLFVTATDLQGQKTSLRLADDVVNERRHRHVFAFKFNKETKDNDFNKENNPFLAFASRCTSSFPLAFEPMCLNDITGSQMKTEWEKFYQDYLLDPSQIKPETVKAHPKAPRNKNDKYDTFSARSFADGGYLDNKPFSYAIQTISLRGSQVPVDRKLIYIEPSPEHLPDELTVVSPPNAFENVLKAFNLARYETIKEDLRLITARNRLIDTVGRILDGTLQDIQINDEKRDPDSVDNWLGTPLKEMINKEGIAYGGYIRLRVSMLIADLAEIIACQSGFNVHSDLGHAISFIIRAWSENEYEFYASLRGERKTYNQFLYDFDISFFIRRLNFTIANLDSLYRMAGEMEEVPHLCMEQESALENPYEIVRRVIAKGEEDDFRKQLSKIRKELCFRLAEIQKLKAGLLRPNQNTKLTEKINNLKLNSHLITREILGASSEKEALKKASTFITNKTAFSEVTEIIKSVVVKANLHSHLCKHLLELGTFFRPDDPAKQDIALKNDLQGFLVNKDWQAKTDIRLKAIRLPTKSPQNSINSATWATAYYFRRFSYYDLVAFPILQTSNIGEELDIVDVIRISPEDATALSDAGERKLGGTTIMHFGAFFDRTWRKNDILWGRLDGAERIISSLLTGTPLENEKQNYIKRAHEAILQETFLGGHEKGESRKRGREMLDLLTSALLGKTKMDRDAVVQQITKSQTKKEMQDLIDGVLKGNLKAQGIYEDLFKNYEVDRDINPKTALKAISRSAQVFGKILDGISDDQDIGSVKKKAATWIIRMGRILWGLIEVAIPQSIFGAFFRYWMSMLLLISLLLMFFGPMITGGDIIQRFGLLLFFMVVLFYAARHIIRKILFQKFRYLSALKNIFIGILTALIVVLLAIGLFYLPEAWQSFLAKMKIIH